ncbi:MAG TPA: metallophosphoesterase [Pirellulales bacterium]|nr:metallophosphoesterase [Pirellulales bacterium]
MKRFAWLTDIHLNFLPIDRVDAFLADVARERPDGVLLGGDIAEAIDLGDFLERIDERLGTDVYFVLGNHDYYYGWIDAVREQVRGLCADRPRLHYLSETGPVELAPGVGLVGHDGWADARLGNYEKSVVSMQDFRLIGDFVGLGKAGRLPRLHALGDEAAKHIARVLPEALAKFEQVVLLTHLPPLREACWHEGKVSDDDWAPFFTCRAVGDAILAIMAQHPERRLLVLCGHTHGSGIARPLENVEILTGGAVYGEPVVQRVFEWN